MPLFIPAPANSWQYRAIKFTGGNQTIEGCIILAILGWQHGRHPPRFGRLARIDKNGILFSNMQTKAGAMIRDHKLGPIADIVESFKRLADDLKLMDGERKQMFDELKKWCWKDDRAQSTL